MLLDRKKYAMIDKWRYRAFHRFGKAKFPDGGSVLGFSQFSILPNTPNMMLRSK
jgi:hypothetical protein